MHENAGRERQAEAEGAEEAEEEAEEVEDVVSVWAGRARAACSNSTPARARLTMGCAGTSPVVSTGLVR